MNKYEDFVKTPDTQLRAICDDLALPFDSSFVDRFYKFDCVTGDMAHLRGKRISAPKKRVLPPGVMEEFQSNSLFSHILEDTGYADPIAYPMSA